MLHMNRTLCKGLNEIAQMMKKNVQFYYRTES